MFQTSPYIALTNNKYDIPIKAVLGFVFLLLSACQSQQTIPAYGDPKSTTEYALFNIPEAFNLLFVNGKKHTQPLLSKGTRLRLAAGSYNFAVEYDMFWINELGDDDRITSQPVLVTFKAEPGKHYQLEYSSPKDIHQAKLYAKQPLLSIRETSSNQTVASRIKYQLEDELLKTRFNELANMPVIAGNAPSPEHEPSPKASGNSKAMEMLQYWWNQADEAQKQGFKQWLEQQP